MVGCRLVHRLGRAAEEEGGQRWFHLYPSERITHKDELHWTRPAQNWNFMCADCHSTGVRKNYDAATDNFRHAGRRSTSAAKPVTAPARVIWHGPKRSAKGGLRPKM